MKIIIVGAGQVGATLAENLVSEKNDITVIDINFALLENLKDKYDLQVIEGHGAHPRILENAGIRDTNMLIAVTSSDEVNMIACQVAYSLFQTPTKIARIRSHYYLDHKDILFHNQELPVDFYIAPEHLVIEHIKKLIAYPGSLQVLQFASGKVSLVAVKAYYGGALVGNSLSSLRDLLPNIDTRIAAIFRGGISIIAQGTTVIEADDEIFFIADTTHVKMIMAKMQKLEHDYKKIMIVGAGNIGLGLAKELENTHQIKLIEKSAKRAAYVASKVNNTTVFCGDASDQELLLEEQVDKTDLFLALTNDDEANIMSAMLAKKLGAGKTMVLIQRGAYVSLVEGQQIDIAISPQQATISALLTHVRKADIVNVYSLRHGAAEVIEAKAHGDNNSSKVVGRAIKEIKLPKGATIGAIIRDKKVIIAHGNTFIATNDHLIIFLINKKGIKDIEKLFELKNSILFD